MKKLVVAVFALGAFALASFSSGNDNLTLGDLGAGGDVDPNCPIYDWSYCFAGNGGNGQYQRWEDFNPKKELIDPGN
ncbi:MAG: hypothetical protein AAFQ98_07925 [Bacteroidota bacterium]